MTTASSISPNWRKYARRVSSVVWYGSPPTNSFVYVLSFWRRIGESVAMAAVTHTHELLVTATTATHGGVNYSELAVK